MHNKNSAMAFVVLLGVVRLFSDMTHEAATSIKGAYLLILGASASTIGFISGVFIAMLIQHHRIKQQGADKSAKLIQGFLYSKAFADTLL